MAKKKYTPLVTHESGVKFVESAAIMSPLMILISGLTIVRFEGDKKSYFYLDDAIEWLKKEAEHHSQEVCEANLAILILFKNDDKVVYE